MNLFYLCIIEMKSLIKKYIKMVFQGEIRKARNIKSVLSLSKKEVSSEGMKPPSEIKRVKEEEKGERVGMAGVP